MSHGQDLLSLAASDPAACVAVCEEILASEAGLAEKASAHRAMGMAYRELGYLQDSIHELELARGAYAAIGDEILEAECSISLAASIAVAGELGNAIEMLEPLVVSSDKTVRAHAQVQKAGLIARKGDFDESLRLYGLAQPDLEEHGDMRWLAFLHSTRGLVRTYREEFANAGSDLATARQLFAGLGMDANAAQQTHNLGFVAVARGDIARGLSLLVEAEDEFRRVGLPAEGVLGERANAYMMAGLPARALDAALAAARGLTDQGRELERTEMLDLAARAAIANEEYERAIGCADEAARLADEQNRQAWWSSARVVAEEARYRSGQPGDVASLVEIADSFADQGNSAGASHAMALAALISLETGDVDRAHEFLDSVDQKAPAYLELPTRLLIAVARAKVQLAVGDRHGALGILTEAADRLDEHRLMLSATETRAGVSMWAEEIGVLGLEASTGDPTSVVSWIERFRAASLRIAPVVVTGDAELAAALAELRSTVRQLGEATRVGEDVGKLARQVNRQENRVRDLAIARESDPEVFSRVESVEELATAIGSGVIVYLYDMAGSIHAELIDENALEPVELGEGERIRFLARHMVGGLRRDFVFPGRADPVRTRQMLAELGDIFFGSAPDVSEVVVVPPSDLVSLPWNAMASAVDQDLSVVVAPSASMWLHARSRSKPSGGITAMAGPGLGHAPLEAKRVGQMYRDAEVLIGEDASVEGVKAAMARGGRLHAVAHTRLRHDNPMFSALELADGLLNLYDLEDVESVPASVILSACDSASGNVVGGHEMFGLTSVLLGRGTRSIIATVAPIPDSDATVEASERLHRALIDGSSPAEAVHRTQAGAVEDRVDPSLAFVAYGA